MTYLGHAIVSGRIGDLDNIFINYFFFILSYVLNLKLFGTTFYLGSEIDL